MAFVWVCAVSAGPLAPVQVPALIWRMEHSCLAVLYERRLCVCERTKIPSRQLLSGSTISFCYYTIPTIWSERRFVNGVSTKGGTAPRHGGFRADDLHNDVCRLGRRMSNGQMAGGLRQHDGWARLVTRTQYGKVADDGTQRGGRDAGG